jgi:dTDP-glucose 4,6-dehydratase
LAKLFRLIESNMPVPLIGYGTNRYQMVSVNDCVNAALRAVAVGLPAGPFNLGSQDPPTVRELLQEMIDRVGSHSRLVATPPRLMKTVLSLLDRGGLTLLHPEQFLIADQDYVLDLSHTAKALSLLPRHNDRDMLIAGFEAYRVSKAHPAIQIRP